MPNDAYLYLQSQIHVHPSQAVTPGQTTQTVLRNQLPAATGDNKYTEEMVPGYTGKALSTMTMADVLFKFRNTSFFALGPEIQGLRKAKQDWS